jgi:hypothetical protein
LKESKIWGRITKLVAILFLSHNNHKALFLDKNFLAVGANYYMPRFTVQCAFQGSDQVDTYKLIEDGNNRKRQFLHLQNFVLCLSHCLHIVSTLTSLFIIIL